MKLKGFIGPTYHLRSLPYEAQQTINLFPEKDELQTGKEQEVAMLLSVPGFDLTHALPRSPVRGILFSANGFIYVVSGNGLYLLTITTPNGVQTVTHTLIGLLNTSTGPVSMQDGVPNYYNGIANTGLINQCVCVDGSAPGLCWQEGTTQVFQMNASNGYVGSAFVTFQDGFFLFSQPGTISAYYAPDPLNISDLDLINVNLSGDQVQRVISDHDIVWIFGKKTLSVWQNTGGSSSSNVFQQIPGAAAEGGCSAPGSLAKVAGQLIWATNDDRGFGQVCVALGYRGVRISNHAVETWLQSLGDISGATAWTYQDGGHSFYVLNVPGATTSWAYDTVTQLWCERGFWANGQWSRDLIGCHANVSLSGLGPIHLCGDYQSGNLYALDDSNYTFNGTPIRRVRTAPHMSGSLKRVFYSRMQVDLEAGVGLDGTGLQVQQGTTGAPFSHTATQTLCGGNSSPFTFTGLDGSAVIPTTVPTITPTVPLAGGNANWSSTYIVDYGHGTLVLAPATLTLPTTQIGVGNGIQASFGLPNLYNLPSTTSASFTVTDWRGTNTQMVYPAVNQNLCQSSTDFNYAGIWTLIGVNCMPSSWATLTVVAPSVGTRASASTVNNLTVTGAANAYGLTGVNIGTSGAAATGNLVATTSVVTGSITYSGFGTGNYAGTLNLSGIFTFPTSNNQSGISISIVADGLSARTVEIAQNSASDQILSTFITVNDLSTLQVIITLNALGGTTAMTLYDIVLLNNALTVGASVNAPDGSNTGTFLTEDTSNGAHRIQTPYPVTLPQTTGLSVYALAGDTGRYLFLYLYTPGTTSFSTAIFNLATGVIVSHSSTSGGGKATITSIGGGVYRCWISMPETQAGNSQAWIGLNNTVNNGYPGNGLSPVGIWGVQIDTNGAVGPNPLVQTAGATAEDYVVYNPSNGNVKFNIPPLGPVTNTAGTVTQAAATISVSLSFSGTYIYPTEFQASFNYLQAAPNYVNVGVNPQVGLSYSDDGGKTFCPERFTPMGTIGARFARAIWRRLGMSRDRVFRVTCSDPVKFNLLGAEIDAKTGEVNGA